MHGVFVSTEENQEPSNLTKIQKTSKYGDGDGFCLLSW